MASTILFFTAGTLSASQVRYSGVRRFAREHGLSVQSVECVGPDTPVDEVIRFWRPQGVILEYGENLPRDMVKRFKALPVVCLDRDPAWGGVCVCQDSYEAGRLIAHELLRSGGRQSFGYVGFTERKRWDEERRQGFVETLASYGMPCSVFKTSNGQRRTLFRRLGAWLSDLPHPCGIMASTDGIAEKVVGVCSQLGLTVPQDVSIAGVDNALHICESTVPTLTSVAPDFEGSGYIAAELLLRLSEGHPAGDQVVRFPQLGLVRRASTAAFREYDHAVAVAREYIRTHISNGLRVTDVLSVFPCSRRSAELRFRKSVGHGIFEEIDRVRIECAKTLLMKHGQAIAPIASLCGFGTEANLRRAFHRAEGMSLRMWRKRKLKAL